MKLHLFNFYPNGLIRLLWHVSAGWKVFGFRFLKYFPASTNSFTTAANLAGEFNYPSPKTLIDVGANESQMAKLLLEIFPGMEVFSFEPNPLLKPMGKVFSMALGDENCDDVPFYLPKDSTWASLSEDKAFELCALKMFVTVRRFDSLSDVSISNLQKPIILKVDAEGWELNVLLGFGNCLSEIDYVLLEMTNGTKETFCVYSLLQDHGFNCSKILYAGHDGSSLPGYTDVLFWRG